MDVARATEVGVADVYKAGTHAATLTRTDAGVRFAYAHGYDGPPVATTLPLSTTPVLHPAGAVPPFFSGLLPEGRRLAALRRQVKTSADDELSLLVAVGADPVGDVQIVPEGERPDRPAPKLSADLWTDVRFDDLLRDEGIDPVALAGVQPKVSAAMLAVPVMTTSGHHLLKLSPPEFPHLVENEAFFMRAARRSGLQVAEAEVVQDREARTGLLVTRFDRHIHDGQVTALAQEDGCQVLRRYPADKYTVTTEQVTAALVAVTRARPVAARELFSQVAFAYLTGNGDLHAKNLSVGQTPQGEWRVTPAYDLPSSQPYGDTTMALTIQGRKREDITRDTLLALAEAIGLRPRAARSAIDTLVDAVDDWLPDLETLPFDERRIHRLRRVVLDRRNKLAAERAVG